MVWGGEGVGGRLDYTVNKFKKKICGLKQKMSYTIGYMDRYIICSYFYLTYPF